MYVYEKLLLRRFQPMREGSYDAGKLVTRFKTSRDTNISCSDRWI